MQSTKDKSIQDLQTKQLVQGLVYADRYVNRQYLVKLDLHEVLQNPDASYQMMRLYRISKFIYDADEDINDKLIHHYWKQELLL